jgi:hypothetical protein
LKAIHDVIERAGVRQPEGVPVREHRSGRRWRRAAPVFPRRNHGRRTYTSAAHSRFPAPCASPQLPRCAPAQSTGSGARPPGRFLELQPAARGRFPRRHRPTPARYPTRGTRSRSRTPPPVAPPLRRACQGRVRTSTAPAGKH